MAMAMSRADDQPLMELNTTPLIDVMLVLLVMFIVTIPLQTHAVKIDLPGVTHPLPASPDPVVNTLTVSRSGIIGWNGAPIDLTTLGTYLDRTRAMTPEPELHFQPEAAARFDTVDHVLATVKRSGVSKFGFVGNERFYRYNN
ncbi:Biopolymer transport protein ExbD [Sphingomonas antarctica]|uniref:ExbD/TolR family protein n=1 Tax=Sphingomonas antarctica TaxID=2040274 RepID=UPI0039E90811